MQIIIDIPEEQIKKSLEESKNINEVEGKKGFVDISMLYTNARLKFVDVVRKTDFYSCKYKILPKGHGNLKDMGNLKYIFDLTREDAVYSGKDIEWAIKRLTTIIEADN